MNKEFYHHKTCLINFSANYKSIIRPICDALLDLVPFVQFKKGEKHHGGVLILVKLQAEACNFNKINTPPWVFSTFSKLYKGTKSHNASRFKKLLKVYGIPFNNS